MARVAALFRAHGMTPPWLRAWRDGVDVTAESPETYAWYVQGQRGDALRQQWLGLHVAARDERAGSADG